MTDQAKTIAAAERACADLQNALAALDETLTQGGLMRAINKHHINDAACLVEFLVILARDSAKGENL